MKQTILLITLLAVSTLSFAESPMADRLASMWKTQQSLHAQLDKNDITMVYGGADISERPSSSLSKTIT